MATDDTRHPAEQIVFVLVPNYSVFQEESHYLYNVYDLELTKAIINNTPRIYFILFY